MRTGGCTVQQTLTTEAASVLKHSLDLAKRRGHAQVTPLHVAATLLSSTREADGLFRRACLKSHPLHPNSRSLHCRALELCFNVALNRLPTIPPPSSGPLIPSHPSLSNALVAALKRAQAHQRRGCIEQQQHHHHHHHQQQPLLAIKVEVGQLIISILDDPSVSRVMREAGYSSTCIKNNLEEDTSSSSTSTLSPPAFFDTLRGSSFWKPHLLKSSLQHSPSPVPSQVQEEDVRLVVEVLLGKNKKRRSNTVVVGDSASCTEGLVAELMGKVEKGDVPEELRSAQFVKFQLSALQLKFMSSTDLDAKLCDLRRKVGCLTSERRSVIVYLGDIKWAVDNEEEGEEGEEEEEEEEEEGEAGGGWYGSAKHAVSELGRLQREWRHWHGCSASSSRVWMMATASYQTYMRCQTKKQASLEVEWGLQAVAVPSGGLALSLHVPSGMDSGLTTSHPNPFQTWESKHFCQKDGHVKLMCCAECTANFERESTALGSGYNKESDRSASADLPVWLQPRKHHNHHRQQDLLMEELRHKWSSLCQRLHHSRHNQMQASTHSFPCFGSDNYGYGSLHPLLCSNSPQFKRTSFFPDLNSFATTARPGISDLLSKSRDVDAEAPVRQERKVLSRQRTPDVLGMQHTNDNLQVVRTTLALGCTSFSESAILLKDRREGLKMDKQELHRRLVENIHWQSEAVRAITNSLLDEKVTGRGAWLMLKGNDWVGKRRLAMVVADCACGSVNNLVYINAAMANVKVLMGALQEDAGCVVMIEAIDRADAKFLKFLSDGFETGRFQDDTSGRAVSSANAIFVLASTPSHAGRNPDSVIEMRLQTESMEVVDVAAKELKRKAEPMTVSRPKNQRKAGNNLDLNIKARDPESEEDKEEEENTPSDLTHEMETTEISSLGNFLCSNGVCLVLDLGPEHLTRMSASFLSRINQAFDEVRCSDEEECGCFSIDGGVLEELVAGSGFFLENMFDKWLKEVLQPCLKAVKKGGKLRLCLVEGRADNSLGLVGSCLPSKIQVN